MPKKQPGSGDFRYEVITQEDPDSGDLIIPIPEPVLKEMGWKEGDEVNIDIDKDGKIYLKKK
jgi:AbrB family looped-hinge helix DNA binding protein